jgi:two-component system, OmpR family, sensor kinase
VASGTVSDENGRSLRRRLTLTIVLLTVGTLLVTGVVTLALTVHSARQQTRREVAREAIDLAVGVRAEAIGNSGDVPSARLRRILAVLKRPLHLDGSAVVTVRPDGSLEWPTGSNGTQPLDGLRADEIDGAGLVAGGTVSGIHNNLVFAAAPLLPTYHLGATALGDREVVVLVRRAPSGLAAALPWLLISSTGVLIVAVVVADRLARRTVGPLRTVEAVTARIAAGDLSARVGAAPGTDPELRNLGASINAMAQALAVAQGTQRQFLLSVSHELRTPLTSIQGFAEALEDGTTTDVARAAGIIAAESRRLDRLVSDLLELAHLDTGQFSLRPGPVRLPGVVAEAVAAFEPAAAALGLSLATTVEGADVDVVADPDRLTQVISNLVENALNYASRAVHVGAAVAGGIALVWVDDDGPGVATEDLSSIFTRLFSSVERPGRKVGTGLGLAIVAELVASMGGDVRAESPLGPGGGTRLMVTLPVSGAPGPAAIGAGLTPPSPPPPPPLSPARRSARPATP